MKIFFSKKIFFLSAKHTPFKNISTIDLSVIANKYIIKNISLFPTQINTIIFENTIRTSINANTVDFACAIPKEIPGLTTNH